jgi:Protein of unknown function (DUF3489)
MNPQNASNEAAPAQVPTDNTVEHHTAGQVAVADPPEPNGEPQTEQPVDAVPEAVPTETLVDAGAQTADVAPEQLAAENRTTPVKKARAKKNPKAEQTPNPEATGPCEGSKTAQVVAMLQREQGATIREIMSTMGWQKHTARGFMVAR